MSNIALARLVGHCGVASLDKILIVMPAFDATVTDETFSNKQF